MRRGPASLLAAVGLTMLAFAGSARAKGCREVSDIVGYEHCNRFGDGWAVHRRPPVFVGLSLSRLQFDPTGVILSGSYNADRPNSPTWSVPGRAMRTTAFDSVGYGVRMGGYVLGPLYAGIEWGWGFGHNRFPPFTFSGTTFTPSGGLLNTITETAGGLAGVRLPLGRVSLRVEEHAGGKWISLGVEAPKGDATFGGARAVLETRALIDVWVTPNVTFSAYGATDALDPRQQNIGLVVDWHLRSFDGAFALW
jgi:hypothetical protein